MLSIQSIETILFFLGRADLKGNEVPAFVNVSNELQALRAQQLTASRPGPAPVAEPSPE